MILYLAKYRSTIIYWVLGGVFHKKRPNWLGGAVRFERYYVFNNSVSFSYIIALNITE